MAELFSDRHIGTDADAQSRMLASVGYDSVDALVEAAVPKSIQVDDLLTSSIPAAASEREALAELRALADQNTVRTSMIGLGYYGTITPAVIKRNVLENPSWYTAYIDAITASRTCAVQMFDVAFSRRMCCSRVCRVSR